MQLNPNLKAILLACIRLLLIQSCFAPVGSITCKSEKCEDQSSCCGDICCISNSTTTQTPNIQIDAKYVLYTPWYLQSYFWWTITLFLFICTGSYSLFKKKQSDLTLPTSMFISSRPHRNFRFNCYFNEGLFIAPSSRVAQAESRVSCYSVTTDQNDSTVPTETVIDNPPDYSQIFNTSETGTNRQPVPTSPPQPTNNNTDASNANPPSYNKFVSMYNQSGADTLRLDKVV